MPKMTRLEMKQALIQSDMELFPQMSLSEFDEYVVDLLNAYLNRLSDAELLDACISQGVAHAD